MAPTTERLATALLQAGAPPWMIENAKNGLYDDFKSEIAIPTVLLVAHLKRLGMQEFAQRVVDGEFDSTKEEAEEWANSPEGQETFRKLINGE
jgi:hypothetical protein